MTRKCEASVLDDAFMRMLKSLRLVAEAILGSISVSHIYVWGISGEGQMKVAISSNTMQQKSHNIVNFLIMKYFRCLEGRIE